MRRALYSLPLLVLLLVIPAVIRGYWLYVCIMGLYYAVLASSWALLAGYVGKLSFAHAAFAATGAYTSAILVLKLGISPFLGLPAGAVMAGLTGLFIGILCFRMSGPYLALTTIAYSEILRIFVTSEYDLTRGSYGLNVPPFFAGTEKWPYYYLMLTILCIAFLAMGFLVRSRTGLFLRAIREDEEGAQAMAVRVIRYRVLAFVVASLFAGLAGAFYAHFIQLVSPQMIILSEMAFILAMAIVGGVESLVGAAIGAFFLEILSEYLRAYGEWRLVILGLIILLTIRFAPNGLIFPIGRLLRLLWQRLSPLLTTLTILIRRT
jgi:branched-chain amino acid transport system permease protein